MTMPNMKTETREESELLFSIAPLAHRLYPQEEDRLTCLMDLTACHCNGMPLDLPRLFSAGANGEGGTYWGDFVHDVLGIRRHIDRTTGKLGDCFVPRFARANDPAAAEAATEEEKATISLPALNAQQLSDIFVTVIETPLGDWWKSFEPQRTMISLLGGKEPWYSKPEFFQQEGECAWGITVKADDPEADGVKTYVITADDIRKGEEILARRWPHYSADLKSETMLDAENADCFMQCVVFGDIVYG